MEPTLTQVTTFYIIVQVFLAIVLAWFVTLLVRELHERIRASEKAIKEAMAKDQWVMVEGKRYTPDDGGPIVMEHRHPCGTPDSEAE